MELRQLECFVVLAEELHFGRAAARVHLAPAAFSAQVRRLEAEVGTALFERTSRRVRLTAAGAEALPHARAALAEAGAVATAARRGARAEAGRLRVGLSAVAIDLTGDVVDAFRARHPEATLDLAHAAFGAPSAGLGEGDCDVALVWAPYDSGDQELLTLREEGRAVLLPAAHPLAGAPGVRAVDILGERWVDVPSEDVVWRSSWTLEAMRDGTRPAFGGRATSPEGVLEVVAAGGGVALLPQGLATLLDHPRVRAVPVVDAPPCRACVALPAAPTPLARAFGAVALKVADRARPAHDPLAIGR